MEKLSNTEKVEMYALLEDARQSANGLRQQINGIQEAFNEHPRLKRAMEWLEMIDYGLAKMRKGLDEVIDWESMEGTEGQPEQ